MDYLSHGLWDKYLTYELSQGAHMRVAQLYSRLLRMPIQRLDEYRTRCGSSSVLGHVLQLCNLFAICALTSEVSYSFKVLVANAGFMSMLHSTPQQK